MGKIIAWLRAFDDDGNASNTLRTMALLGEIRHEGQRCGRLYFAILATTRSADESKCVRMENAELSKSVSHQQALIRTNRAGPASYVHKPGSLATANARGQGAVRAKVTCNCSQNY